MKRKFLIAAILTSVAMTTVASAEYNKYNEEDSINLSNSTLQDWADANEVSVDELKSAMGLPEDMPADTMESVAAGYATFEKIAESYNITLDEYIENVGPLYKGNMELNGKTLYKELEGNITFADYMGELDPETVLETVGLSDKIKPEDLLGNVRTVFERKLLQGHLTYLQDDGILVLVKGRYLNFDAAPVIINNRVMVPMRAIFEALGANVNWVGETQTIFAVKGDSIITMQVGQDSFFKNEEKIEIDSPSVIIDERTLVPVRAVAEALDTEVFYNENTKTVVIH